MYSEQGSKYKKFEDDNDFFIADQNKDGRLTFEEFKVISQRIYEEDKRRLTDYHKWTDDELLKRYSMLSSLAKCKEGPSRHVMKKIPKMVLEYYFPLMTLKGEIKNPDAEDNSVERCWLVEEMGKVMSIVQEDKKLMDALPDKV